MNKKVYKKEVAEKSLKKAREQMDEYDKTKRKALLYMAYSNLGFATWFGLNTEEEIKRLARYKIIDISKINEWKP